MPTRCDWWAITGKEVRDDSGESYPHASRRAGAAHQRAVRGKRGVTPETAWLLSQALNTTPEFWISLQITHDLARSRPATMVGRIHSTAE